MATSDVDIANVALRLLKAQRISSLTDGTKNANVVNDIFTEIRESLLGDHNWGFATKRVKLARSSTTPVFDFDYGYVLPSDWLRTVSVHDNDAGTGTIEYQEEELEDQGVLMASVEDVYLVYIYKVTDPNRMSAACRKAFAYELAVSMPGINNISATREAELRREARKALRKAKSKDGMGSTQPRRPQGTWRNSRSSWPHWRIWPD